MIKNIEYENEEGVEVTQERKALFVTSLQMWLRPYRDSINSQNGKVIVYFNKDGTNKFRLEEVSIFLQQAVTEQFPAFIK